MPTQVHAKPSGANPSIAMNHLGVVVIGRNEGERLRCCLTSVAGRGLPVVYVDGNSSDGSALLARSLGALVVEEDPSKPNCAGSARNAGFERLCAIDPNVRFVQFVDADCEVVDDWLGRGHRYLEEHPDVALVAGRRRERFAERSIYNRLADIEWDLPVGEIEHSHGDMMVRVDAFRRIGGFDPNAFVAEDHDLCVRLRKDGARLVRIDAEMTLHDIAMTRFRQWFLRCVRSGYGFPDMALRHGRASGRPWARETGSTIFWGIALPVLILLLTWPTRGASVLLAVAYPLQIVRIARRHRKAGMPARDAWLYGWSCTLCRFPNALGLMRFVIGRLLGWNKNSTRDF
jgi:cellulose synthase/poly-beta-1,6-N-acetylglucosamine synthase-like glycosyltransferase